ncbi:putative B3 domain-containing protein At2g27410 [Manihot esculenta]|uniref:putative B3 domain-containing protein At2g27410 n=1 Tax=Manihot esculenta TaxID=3983 RepID=UPI000B5D368C|nr:putative B3 domain-containing protein At2g27410 [Manihot esculenta]
MRKDLLAASVPKKRRGSNKECRVIKELPLFPYFLHSCGRFAESMVEEKKSEQCFESVNNTAEDHQHKKKKLLKRLNFEELGLDPPPELPSEWMNKIEKKGGVDVKLVIMKQMFPTDLNPHHDRLSIPFRQIRNEFLTEDEKTKLIEQKSITVKLMEPCGSESELYLRQWNLKNTSCYALTTRWKQVIKEFKQNDIIQLWSFRVQGELQLALIKVPYASASASASASTDVSASASELVN